jgi:hypothetical protein
VAQMKVTKNACRISIRKSEGNNAHYVIRRRYWDSIKLDLKEICESVDWFKLAWNRDQRLPVVSTTGTV